jgi:transketolase
MKSFQEYLLFLRRTAANLRLDLLETLYAAQSGHLGGSLSAMDILVALYYGQIPASGPIMNFDPEKPGWDGQDYFVLSKAHAAPAWYCVLADAGFFPKDELKHFRQLNSNLQAFPSRKVPGVPLCSATPGHGLASAVGLATAIKMDKGKNRVFCLAGDGELQDGLIWEAAMVAAQQKLDNLILAVDYNDLQMDGTVRSIVGVEPISDKFQSFGWKIIPVRDGHDFEELIFAFERALENQRRPSVVIAKTVKGKGVEFAENKAYYHAEVLSDQEMAEALPRLKKEIADLAEPKRP